jgi:hypothetical protein
MIWENSVKMFNAELGTELGGEGGGYYFFFFFTTCTNGLYVWRGGMSPPYHDPVCLTSRWMQMAYDVLLWPHAMLPGKRVMRMQILFLSLSIINLFTFVVALHSDACEPFLCEVVRMNERDAW